MSVIATTTTTQPIARPYHHGILGEEEAVAVEMGVLVRAQATSQAACTGKKKNMEPIAKNSYSVLAKLSSGRGHVVTVVEDAK